MLLFGTSTRAVFPILAMALLINIAIPAFASAQSATPDAATAVEQATDNSGPATAAAPEPAAPAATEEYRLTTGDKIIITVFGQKELTGEQVIDSGGNVTVPLVGQIHIADSTLRECEQKITARLSDGFLKQPSISVQISELRPIYVVGDVKLPGTYPYRFGTTVLSAVAIAGGYGGAEILPAVAAADFLLIDERVRVLEQTRLAMLVRQERIAAQLKGASTFDAPIVPVTGVQDQQLKVAVDTERQVLAAQVEAHEKELDLQRGQKPTVKSVIDSVEKQIAGTKTQLSLVTQQFADYAQLDKLGLSKRVTAISLQRERAALESNIAELEANRARLDLQFGEVDIKIQDLDLAYKRRALTEMQDTRTKLAEIEVTLPAARELYELRSQQAGGIADSDTGEVSRTMFILRTRNSVAKRIPAAIDMFLEPGDIIEVKRMRPAGLGTARRSQASAIGGTQQAASALDKVFAPAKTDTLPTGLELQALNIASRGTSIESEALGKALEAAVKP